MEKSMTIFYEVHDNLYVNLTNRCPCACTFCLRQTRDRMDQSGSLWLKREPAVEEVKQEFARFDADGGISRKYREVVFCGFGEPTERLEELLEIAGFVKDRYGLPVRVNTNGLSDLIHGKRTAPMFEGYVDVISISLNTPDRDEYYRLTRSKFGEGSFDALLRFAEEVKEYVPKVVLTTVETTISEEEQEQCRKICEKIGVTYRIRPFE